MIPSDIILVLKWWLVVFMLGAGFLPLSAVVFKSFFDKGYIFSKILAIILITYTALVLGTMRILRFDITSLIIISIGLIMLIFYLIGTKIKLKVIIKTHWRIFLLEEIMFLSALLFWSYIRSFNPDIHGLEKYMDFGFINSILRVDYFPPKDMWLTPFSINYYYFGHLATAVLTKLTNIPSPITFNLMLSTIFALCFTQVFSISANLYNVFQIPKYLKPLKLTAAGIISALLVVFSGNLHVLYSIFKPYENENPIPLWKLPLDIISFPNAYWYPNATRFIYNTIHEFPIYSWVVADLHGHVLDIPIVILTIAVLLSMFLDKADVKGWKLEIRKVIFVGFLLAVMYMTNAWDGGIYFLLSALILLALYHKHIKVFITYLAIMFLALLLFSYPYNHFFEPFTSGIGVLCSPEFLINIKRLGPFLFEENFCQHSPLWQILTLYGFFYFFIFSFFIFIWKRINLAKSDTFILLLITISTFLILLPEFIYLKDIYPAHYRANTMFKLVFQAFIMLSISSGYIIVRLISSYKNKLFTFTYLTLTLILLSLVLTYPFLAIKSYYGIGQKDASGSYKKPISLNGTAYLKNLYPDDYKAILWINKNIAGQPVILEAQGDSYTDFARISSNTGLPTVLGWTVHEWLWRGSYDIPSPRIEHIKTMYESTDLQVVRGLLLKYNVKYVFVGTLEQQSHPAYNETTLKKFGKVVFESGNTKIFEVID